MGCGELWYHNLNFWNLWWVVVSCGGLWRVVVSCGELWYARINGELHYLFDLLTSCVLRSNSKKLNELLVEIGS